MNNPRTVSQVIEPNMVIEGAGVLLRRSIAPNRENLFDPFLLFDHFAFNDPPEPGECKAASPGSARSDQRVDRASRIQFGKKYFQVWTDSNYRVSVNNRRSQT